MGLVVACLGPACARAVSWTADADVNDVTGQKQAGASCGGPPPAAPAMAHSWGSAPAANPGYGTSPGLQRLLWHITGVSPGRVYPSYVPSPGWHANLPGTQQTRDRAHGRLPGAWRKVAVRRRLAGWSAEGRRLRGGGPPPAWLRAAACAAEGCRVTENFCGLLHGYRPLRGNAPPGTRKISGIRPRDHGSRIVPVAAACAA